MKIAFLSTIFGPMAGGGEISTFLLFKQLKAAGHDVYLLTSRKMYPFDGLVPLNQVQAIPLKVIVPGTHCTDLMQAQSIKKKLEMLKPDILHIHDRYTLPAACIANSKLQIPCVFTCRSAILPHSTRAISPKAYAVKAWFEARDRNNIKFLRRVDAVISISDFIKQELLLAGVESEKVKTIYNIPSDLPKNAHLTPPIQMKAKPTLTLFTAGRLDADKGFDIVINAISIYCKNNSDCNIHLIIAGDGPQMQNLKGLVAHSNLESFVTLTGWVSHHDVMCFYANSDIVFLPSVFPDAFGRGSLEALSFGKPVLASDIGGIHEIVVNGVNGYAFPPGDSKLLAAALQNLVNDSCLRERMGKAGLEIMEKNFSNDRLVNETLNLYKKVICCHQPYCLDS